MSMDEYVKSLKRITKIEDGSELLDEAGNISSGIAIKKHNDVINDGI